MAAAVVKDKRVGSNGRILCAACVEQKRCSAHCGIGIRVVEGQRSAANTGVEAAGWYLKERAPTKSCISSAGGEKIKRIAPFRCREIGIAAVRRRTDRLHFLSNSCQREKHQYRHENSLCRCFHGLTVRQDALYMSRE